MVPAFLQDLRLRDIWVWADGDRVRCNAPADALTPELQDQLRSHKSEILAYLRSVQAVAKRQRAIVPLQPNGTQPPVFGVPGHNGDVFCYGTLAQYLGSDQPFFGLHPPGLDGGSEPIVRVEDLAAYFVKQIRSFHSGGPCIIAGFCAGGVIAFEIAQQLQRAGVEIHSIAFFGAYYPTAYRWMRVRARGRWVLKHARALASRSWAERSSYIGAKWRARRARSLVVLPPNSPALDEVLSARRSVERATIIAARRYRPRLFAGTGNLFIPSDTWIGSENQGLRWRPVVERANEYYGPAGCDGNNMLLEPYVTTFAEFFRKSVAVQTRTEAADTGATRASSR